MYLCAACAVHMCLSCVLTYFKCYPDCPAEDLVRDQKGVQITANTAEDEADNSDTGTHEQHISGLVENDKIR